MSLWADYHEETEGHETLETADGFIRYSFAPPVCQIHDLYVVPAKRQTRVAWVLADAVSKLAKDKGMTHLWSRVWCASRTADAALKANLAYGFQVMNAENGSIIMMKELGG